MTKQTDSPLTTTVSHAFQILAVVLLLAIFALELFTVVVQREGDSPLPPLFGNFAANRAVLEAQPDKDAFTFAVVGDTRSVGTFERISENLRRTRLDFAVLLGDCTFGGTEEKHRFFRAECHQEYALPFPVFYVVGNHDVSPEAFPVTRFERDYGPSIFSFEYQHCLFIVLRILQPPFSNQESIEFLKGFREVPLDRYRYTFVFMHIPPVVSPFYHARSYPEEDELVSLFEELHIDYVFAGDFHGYARVKLQDTNYIISGGGGSELRRRPQGQFNHALLVRVSQNSVDERIIYVPEVNDLEDRLEKIAFIEIWPWMLGHPYVTITANAGGIVILLMLVGRPFIRRRKSEGSGATP